MLIKLKLKISIDFFGVCSNNGIMVVSAPKILQALLLERTPYVKFKEV